MEEEEFEFDFKDETQVKDFLGLDASRQKQITEYALEYSGEDEGRKLRDLQVGKREDYTSGKKKVVAERLKIQYQKKVVNTAVSFLFGDAPIIRANDPDKQSAIDILNVFKANRINNKLQDFSEAVMSSTIGVFIFSMGGESGKEIKARFYNSDNGSFTPQYDVYGDLVAFYWQFVLPGKEEKQVWIFTATEIHKYSDEKYLTSDAHPFGVIPAVFVDQAKPEWWEVKEMIDRLEMLVSKLAGSNNFFAFPILKLKGGTMKDADGKDIPLIDIADDGKSLLLGHAVHNDQVIQSDAEFLQRDTGVESITLEKELLQEFIHSISQTPNMSFDNVKGIGAISARAMVLMLQDAINKAKRKRGSYETAIGRILSVIKNGLGINDPDLTFDIEFKLSIPEDIKEQIDTLLNATGGKASMAQETAVQHNPMVKNPSEELDKIKAEQTQSMGETFNV
jgi:SPP1 family phage portal protein